MTNGGNIVVSNPTLHPLFPRSSLLLSFSRPWSARSDSIGHSTAIHTPFCYGKPFGVGLSDKRCCGSFADRTSELAGRVLVSFWVCMVPRINVSPPFWAPVASMTSD